MRKNLPLLLFFVFLNVIHNCAAQINLRLQVGGSYSSCCIGSIQNDTNGSQIISGLYGTSTELGSLSNKLYINEKPVSIIGNRGFYLLKLDENKEIVWNISIELKSTSSTVVPQIVLDDSSNIYLTGKFQGQLVFDSKNSLESATGDDFIAKYTAKGEFKWAKKWTGTSNTINYKSNIDKDNNLYFIGKFSGNLELESKVLHNTIQGVSQSYLLVLDRNGKYLKSKSFDPNIDVNFIEINKNNEVFIAGNFANEATVQGITVKSVGGKDIFYAKFDNNFELQWLKSAGGVKDDNCRGLKVDGIGNAYLAGFITNQANFDDVKLDFNSEIGSNIFLTQINARKGNVNWLRNIEYSKGRSSTSSAPIMSVDILKLDEKNDVYMAGIGSGYITNNKDFYFYNELVWVEYLLKYDRKGNLSESFGKFYRESYDAENWQDLIVTNGYINSVFNLRSFSRGVGVTGLVKVYKSVINEKCKENTVLIQRESSGVFSLANKFIDNHNFNYQWYRNGQYLPNENGFTLKANEPGYYSLKLINKTNSACEVSSSNSIPIFQSVDNYPPILSIDSFRPNTISLSSLIAPKTEWFLDGKLLVGVNNYSYVYSADGTYKAKQYFENGTVKESNEVVIKDGLVLNVTKAVTYDDGDICKPMPNLIATINNQVFPNGDLKYQWYLNGLAVKDSTFRHFRAVMPGDYHAIVFVVSRNQAYSTGRFKIVTEDFPKSLSITKIEDICGAKALLKVDDSFMQRYTFQSIVWKVDDKVIPAATQPFYNANKGGYYTFSVQYKENTIGKTCTYNSFINFEKKNDFKLNLGYAYAGSGCVVDSFKVFTEQNPKYFYSWTKNDVPIEKQATNEIFIKDKARYKGIVKRNDGCVNETDEISLKGCTSDEDEKFLLLNPPKITADKTRFFNDEKALLSFEGCPNVNLQWLKNDQLIVGANQKTLEVRETGNYILEIEKSGCKTATNALKISVETILAVGEENPNFNIEVYPNPTEEKLFVSIPPQINMPIDVKITDVSGKLIEKYYFSDSKSQFIDLKSFQMGVYFLVFDVEGKRVVKRIVKNN